MWDKVGMARNAEGLNQAIVEIAALREEFYKDVKVPGTDKGFNQELEKAVVLLISLNWESYLLKMLHRNESCGGHFREEYQTADGEATRDDENFAYVAALEYKGNQVMLFYIKRHWFSIMLNW
jgi:succinate dehydrogenase / fumarate reductase flavoprotein subunit